MPETLRKIDDEKMGVTPEPAGEEIFLKKNLLTQQAYYKKLLAETDARLEVFE